MQKKRTATKTCMSLWKKNQKWRRNNVPVSSQVFINFAMGKVGMDSIPIEDELVDFDSIHSSDT